MGMSKQRATVLMEDYRGLVRMQAWRAWKALPHSVRVWIGIDDLIEYGMWKAYSYLKNHYDHERSAKVTTGLYHALHNSFIREYIEVHGAWKRGWVRTEDGKLISMKLASLQAMKDKLGTNAVIDDVIGKIPDMVTSPDSIVDDTHTLCHVVPALAKVFEKSSLRLQGEIVNWLWNGEHIRVKSKPFRKYSKEFRKLCKEEQIFCDDVIHLVRSAECMDAFSRKVLGGPFDINDPTPGILNRQDLYIPAQRSYKGTLSLKENAWLRVK
jgi:hypothetical protein